MTKKFNKFKKNQKTAIKFSNTVIIFGILYSVLIVIYATYKILNPPEDITNKFYYMCIFFGLISFTLFVMAIRLQNEIKINLSLLLITVGISIYLFEIYLEISSSNSMQRKAYLYNLGEQHGISYDLRSKKEVIKDLKKAGKEAYPNIYSKLFISSNGFINKIGKIYPLGGISNVTTVFCNENGSWSVFEADEHGFNNPKNLYHNNKVDIMLTGDSFTEGACVKSDESISGVLNKLGINTISIAKVGNGPLIEFASLKEYAEPLQPKIVLWLYFRNDLFDLSSELNSSFLNKYLNEYDFSQKIIIRQDEVDNVLKNYAKKKWESRESKDKINKKNWGIRILKLYNLRLKTNLIPKTVTVNEEELISFKRILDKSNKMVLGWSGKLYFVYLPSPSMILSGNEDLYMDEIFLIAKELNIPIIDIYQEVFTKHIDPSSLFPLINVHYNAEGYKLVAEAIKKRLNADGNNFIKTQ